MKTTLSGVCLAALLLAACRTGLDSSAVQEDGPTSAPQDVLAVGPGVSTWDCRSPGGTAAAGGFTLNLTDQLPALYIKGRLPQLGTLQEGGTATATDILLRLMDGTEVPYARSGDVTTVSLLLAMPDHDLDRDVEATLKDGPAQTAVLTYIKDAVVTSASYVCTVTRR